MSIGTDRVRASFNPSSNGTVDQIKRSSADLIDLCENLRTETGPSEKNRCLALAQTAYEEAAMWAVKAATA